MPLRDNANGCLRSICYTSSDTVSVRRQNMCISLHIWIFSILILNSAFSVFMRKLQFESSKREKKHCERVFQTDWEVLTVYNVLIGNILLNKLKSTFSKKTFQKKSLGVNSILTSIKIKLCTYLALHLQVLLTESLFFQ